MSASLAVSMSNVLSIASLQLPSLAIGKSNSGFALDVAGDVNFGGTLRSNGLAYVGSQWTTSNASSITYSSNVFIGGSINFNGSLNQNGAPYVGSQWSTSNNGLITYGSNVFIGGSLTVAGSNILQNTLIQSSNIVINNAGSGPALQVTQSEATPQPLAQFVAGSNIALYLASNAFVGIGKSNPAYTLDVLGNINVSGSVLVNGAALSNSGGSGGSGGTAAVCQSIWYSNSNVSASNYVGLTASAGTIVQNNSTNGTNPFSVSTGLFTCQYAGTYQCNFTATTVVPQAAVTIYRNGAAISPGYLTYGNVNNSISLSASVYCSATDTLGFYVTQGTIQGAVGGSGTQGCSISLMTSGTAATGMGVPNQVVFTSGSNATWTVPTGVTQIQVEAVGGGGAGGSYGNGAAQGQPSSGGGGAGAYVRTTLAVTGGSSTITYSVGTGGAAAAAGQNNGGSGNNTTLSVSGASGSIVATGGAGGGYNNATAYANGVGGIGGVPTNTITAPTLVSILTANGGDGFDGSSGVAGAAAGAGGSGGASYFGSGGRGDVNGGTGIRAGNAYGSGGGGASGGNASNAGANGAPGAVIITYFTQSGLPTTYTASAPLSMSGTTLSIANATASSAGVVQVDGTSIIATNGVISLAKQYCGISFRASSTQTGYANCTLTANGLKSTNFTINTTSITGLTVGTVYKICGSSLTRLNDANPNRDGLRISDGNGVLLTCDIPLSDDFNNPKATFIFGYFAPTTTTIYLQSANDYMTVENTLFTNEGYCLIESL